MQNYEGCSCPVCKKPFLPSDDIVVCPECGAPYHRACYQLKGACVFEEMHGPGFEWKRPASAPKLGKCPNCGASYTGDLIFCEQCGAPLHTEEPRPAPGSALPGMQGPVPLGAAEEMKGEIDGIPVADWASYIGPSAPYYLYQFKRMDVTGHKVGFVFSAAFIAPIYFLYRKMWGLGILAGALNLLLNLPAALLMLAEFGIVFALPISYATLGVVASVCSALLGALQIVGWGMFASCFYRRHCARRIRRIRQEAGAADEAAYHERLRRRGGPSKAVLIGLVVFYALTTILTFVAAGAL